MSMRRVPNEVFGLWEFLDRKFVRIIFRGRGPSKSTILGLFRNRWSKFLSSGKKCVFWDLDFFKKSRKWGVIFWECALTFFSQLWTNVESFQKKIFGIGGKLVELQGLLSSRFFCSSTVTKRVNFFFWQRFLVKILFLIIPNHLSVDQADISYVSALSRGYGLLQRVFISWVFL